MRKLLILCGLLMCLPSFAAVPPGLGTARNIGLISMHFDNAPDPDDIMTAAANRTLLGLTGFTSYVVVSGTTGDNAKDYIPASEAVMDTIWGMGNWYNAYTSWATSVQSVADAWQNVLDAGGDIWVAEAGQSNFTRDVVTEILSRQPALSTTTRIHVVQHSTWNEDHTTPTDLTYVQANTDYIKIDDGNDDNGTADLCQTETDWWKNMALNNRTYGTKWSAALTYFIARRYEAVIDFSDTVELLYILGIPKTTLSGINDFARTYFPNTANDLSAEPNTIIMSPRRLRIVTPLHGQK